MQDNNIRRATHAGSWYSGNSNKNILYINIFKKILKNENNLHYCKFSLKKLENQELNLMAILIMQKKMFKI